MGARATADFDRNFAFRGPLVAFFNRAFLSGCEYFPWRGRFSGLSKRIMTRASIELATKIFLVALILTFIWTVYKVLVQMGLI